MRERGEIATAIIVAGALGIFILGLALPKFTNIKLFEKTAANKKASWSKESKKKEPVILFDQNKKAVGVATREEYLYETGMESGTPAPTLGEKIGSFFANLTTAGLIFVGVSLLFFGGAPLVWMARKYHIMKHAFKNTVQAIREIDDETYSKIKPVLAAKHDKSDRKIVDKLKTELN